MKYSIYTLLSILLLSSCNFNQKNTSKQNTKTLKVFVKTVLDTLEKNDAKKAITIQATKQLNTFKSLINSLPLKKLPLIDSTNFDNFTKTNPYTLKQKQLLKLDKNLADFAKKEAYYPNYRLNMSENFVSIVLTRFRGEEMESLLINYEKEGGFIDYKIISYDEIAEGWSRTVGDLHKKHITITSTLWTEPKQVTIQKYSINELGYFNKIPLKHKSNIRPKESITLNKIYADTLTFDLYNDDYDYAFFQAYKKDSLVSLNYNWDSSNSKYNFNKGDKIIVKWKMDSIWIAGDGETLYFAEWAIDAIKMP